MSIERVILELEHLRLTLLDIKRCSYKVRLEVSDADIQALTLAIAELKQRQNLEDDGK